MKPLKTTAQERKRLRDQVAGMRFVCCLDSPDLHSGNCLVGRLERALEDLETAIDNTVTGYAAGRRDERADVVVWLRGGCGGGSFVSAFRRDGPPELEPLKTISAPIGDRVESGIHVGAAKKGGGQ